MKKKITILTTILALSFAGVSYSQEDITDFMNFGEQNASKFTDYYIAPLGHSIGNNLNSGWYNTGQAHRLGRFDIRFAVPVTFVGEDERYFSFDPDDYEGLSLVDVEDNKSPTLFGSTDEGPEVFFDGTEDMDTTFTMNLPPGIGIGYFPLVPPVLQLNVGLFKDTEVKIRYVPKAELEGFSTGLYGFGLKHGISQYIPVFDRLPLDLSLIGTYANMSSAFDLDYNSPDNSVNDQKLDISASAYSANLVASTKLPIITFYGGLRYMYSNTQFLVLGDYDVGPSVFVDPVDSEFERSQVGLNAGIRLKLGFLCLFVDGTLANYSSVTGGISLGLHN